MPSNTQWVATDLGALTTTAIFRLASGIVDDNEGGEALGTVEISIPIRLVQVTSLRDVAAINEQVFPGSNAYTYVFYGWINDPDNYTFPDALRGQERVTGEAELYGRTGRIECSIPAGPLPGAAERIGEKFTAGWVRD